MRKGITITAVAVFAVLALAESATAYYSPAKGRFLARDPIGEEGGKSLYESMVNAPVDLVDPIGLLPESLAAAYARNLLRAYQAQHMGTTYYRPAGLPRAFARLEWARTQTNVGFMDLASSLWFGSKEAVYLPALNSLWIRLGTANGTTVVHELVHALDDRMDWYIRPSATLNKQAEALAYSVEYMLTAAGYLASMDNPVMTKNCTMARSTWKGAWTSFAKIIGSPYEYPQKASITQLDLWDAHAKLGIRFSCSQLRPLYEQQLAKRGIMETFTSAPTGAAPCPCKLTCNFGNSLRDYAQTPCGLPAVFQ